MFNRFINWLIFKGPGTFGFGCLFVGICNGKGNLIWTGIICMGIGILINKFFNGNNHNNSSNGGQMR